MGAFSIIREEVPTTKESVGPKRQRMIEDLRISGMGDTSPKSRNRAITRHGDSDRTLIQVLLGPAKLTTTARCTDVATRTIRDSDSPLRDAGPVAGPDREAKPGVTGRRGEPARAGDR
jgi:hypothetical protein